MWLCARACSSCDAEEKAAASDRRMFLSSSWVYDRQVGHFNLQYLVPRELGEDHGFMRVYTNIRCLGCAPIGRSNSFMSRTVIPPFL